MRLIDGDAFKTWIDEYVSVFKKSDKAEIKGYISHQPSIDIVRCKECKHYNGSYCFNIEALMPKAPNPNDFCSYGERNEQTERSEK